MGVLSEPQAAGYAHKLAELGADAIIAQHPHVIQPIEIYRPQSDPDKQVPILYSLGNLTPFAAPPYTVLSLVANLRISTGKLNGEKRTMVTGLEITPVACLAEQDDDGSMNAALVPLAELENMKLERRTRDLRGFDSEICRSGAWPGLAEARSGRTS